MTFRPKSVSFAALCLSAALATSARSEETSNVALAPDRLNPGVLETGEIRGHDSIAYTLEAAAGQVLSVDLNAADGAVNFTILRTGAADAVFTSDTDGPVADLPLSDGGPYTVEVYLLRSAARRDVSVAFDIAIALNGADFADGLAGGPDWWQVTNVPDGALAGVHVGPSARYAVAGQAGNGDAAQNRGCRLTLGERWCSVRLAGTGLQGWLPGAVLMEGAAPTPPEMPAGGPVGNGTGFDATGSVPCALQPAQPMGQCLFGVVRDGPGNAGIWLAIGGGDERQITFEKGLPVAANVDAPLGVEKVDDLFKLTVGEERYEIPEAVISGG